MINKNKNYDVDINDEKFKQFLPPEGEDFLYLKHLNNEEISKLPPEIAKFYDTKEPEAYKKAREQEE